MPPRLASLLLFLVPRLSGGATSPFSWWSLLFWGKSWLKIDLRRTKEESPAFHDLPSARHSSRYPHNTRIILCCLFNYISVFWVVNWLPYRHNRKLWGWVPRELSQHCQQCFELNMPLDLCWRALPKLQLQGQATVQLPPSFAMLLRSLNWAIDDHSVLYHPSGQQQSRCSMLRSPNHLMTISTRRPKQNMGRRRLNLIQKTSPWDHLQDIHSQRSGNKPRKRPGANCMVAWNMIWKSSRKPSPFLRFLGMHFISEQPVYCHMPRRLSQQCG